MSQAYHVTGELTDSQHVKLDEPVPLPTGKVRLVVAEMANCSDLGESTLGLGDDELPDTPEGIEAWIRWYDQLEPLEFTDAERAAWSAAREEQKQLELAQWEEHSRRLEEHFR